MHGMIILGPAGSGKTTLGKYVADKMEIVEVRCMNLCKDIKTKYNKGPFVMVNDELIEEATFEKVVTKIREIIKAQEG